MKAIAVHLAKGGVGKTSVSGALAFELAKRGRTILLDCDQQGNASSWHLTTAPEHELADVLTGKVNAADAIVKAPGGFDMLATFGLDGTLKAYGETGLTAEPFIFQDLVSELARLGYEYAILDLSPGLGQLEKAALLGASEVLTPMLPEYFSLDGLETFAHDLAKIRKAMRYAPEHRLVVVNAFDSRIGQHHTVAEQAEGIEGKRVFRLPVDPAIRKAQALHVSIQALPRDNAAKHETLAAYAGIAEAIA